jgi:hypothetical protein
MSKELEFDLDFKGGKAIVKISHEGAHGFAKLEAGADALPVLNKAIDKIEELVPGDQKQYAALLKVALSNLEF